MQKPSETTATPAIAINERRKPELITEYGFFSIIIMAESDTADNISYLLPSTCASTAHMNITIALTADTPFPVITPNRTTIIPLIAADAGYISPLRRSSLYKPIPISEI